MPTYDPGSGGRWTLWYLVPLGMIAMVAMVSVIVVSALSGTGDGSDATAAEAAEAAGRELPPYWKIRAGDTYSRIAQKTGLTVEQLETFNPRTDPTRIVPGQRIKLRLHVPKPKRKLGPRFWRVRQGQSFGSIAARTGRTIETLQRLNPKIKASEVQPGDLVRLRR